MISIGCVFVKSHPVRYVVSQYRSTTGGTPLRMPAALSMAQPTLKQFQERLIFVNCGHETTG